MSQGLKLDGTAYFDRFDSAGKPQGYVQFPNLLALALEAASETKEVVSTGLSNAGAVIDSYTKAQPTKGSISANQMDDKAALAAFFLGNDSALNTGAGTVTNEGIILKYGKLVELAQRNISKTAVVTVTSPTLLTLGTGNGALTVFQKSAVPTLALIDPAANDVLLSIIVTGNDVVVTLATDIAGAITTTAAELVAELNSNGSIVGAVLDADGSDVVTAAGQASLASAVNLAVTDFNVQYELGLIELTNTALYPSGLHSITYAHAAISGYQIDAATNSTVKGKLLFIGKSAVNGNTVELEAHKVTLSPSGSMELLGDADFAEGAWDISFEVAGQSAPFTLKNYVTQV